MRRKAESVLKHLINVLTEYLDELSKISEEEENFQFAYGEQTAYTECLELIESWERAAESGLDFDVEKRFPLTGKRKDKKTR